MSTSYIAAMLPGADEWCQRWRRGQHSWRRTSEGGFDPARYAVVPCKTAPVKKFIRLHHYSHAAASTVHGYALIDLWPDPDPDAQWLAGGQLVGALTLGSPMTEAVLTSPFPDLEPFRQSLDLNRMVLLDKVKAPAESWFARALRLAARAGLRGVVAYSDPVGRHRTTPDGDVQVLTPGHVGHVYKILGALPLKRARRRRHILLPDATTLVARSANKITGRERGWRGVVRRLVRLGAPEPKPGENPADWLAKALKFLGAIEFDHPGNYRFAFRLGSRRQRRRVRVEGVTDAYPTHRAPSVAVPDGRPR